MPSASRKAADALRKIEAARVALEKEQRRLAKSKARGVVAARKEVAALLDKLDETEFALLNAREEAQRAAREARSRAYVPHEPEYPTTQGERVVIERELMIRGYWDRYPKADQSRHRNRYKHIPKAWRRGPTAYDVLVKDYSTFTFAERRRLVLRVSYGVNFATGEILTHDVVVNDRLDIRLSMDRNEALAALSTFLVRGGSIDSPRMTANTETFNDGDDSEDEEDDVPGVPLGVQWVILPPEKKRRKGR